ncbi:MAG: hypothetical protein AAB778_00475 [Patescibacteria group bacterium]
MTKKGFTPIKSGFTLVELLLYMALVVIFLGVLTSLFVSVLDVKNESTAQSSIEQDGRFILSRLLYDASVAGSDAITLNYSLVGKDLILNNEKLNSSETSVLEFTTLSLGNIGGKKSLQVKFKLEAGLETRDYQITLGSR